MITYDRELLADLDRRFPNQVAYTKFEDYLDAYLRNVKGRNLEEVRKDLSVFDEYYFRRANDEGRRAAFQRLLDRDGEILYNR